ncbi:hypothetical protein [Phenylobacterium aquaticum]|uniref:hypothetical protein n=1 Tax=Phenylobacterium aquaticum TaxID=1763816 RepID=UPI0026EB48A8|nr:hypothetical protein [Phenylobacterium aquaticum]
MKTSLAALTATALCALAGAAHAQTAGAAPVAQATLTALKACAANAQGALAFNPPSPGLDAAGVILADSGYAPDLAAFKDISPSERFAAAVNSAQGQIILMSDTTRQICRLAVEDITPAQVALVQAAVRGMAGDWVPQSNTGGATTYSGTVAGSSQLMFEVRVPAPKTGYGTANFILTVMNPAGPG